MHLASVISDFPNFNIKFDPKLSVIKSNALEAIKYVFNLSDWPNAAANITLAFRNKNRKRCQETKIMRQFDKYCIDGKEVPTEMLLDFWKNNKLNDPQKFLITEEQLKQVLKGQPNELFKMVEEAAAPAVLKGGLYADFAQICDKMNWFGGGTDISYNGMYMQLCQGLQAFKKNIANLEHGIAQLSCAQAENTAKIERSECAAQEIEQQLKEQLLVELSKLEHKLAASRELERSALASLKAAEHISHRRRLRRAFKNHIDDERYLRETKAELAGLQRGEYRRLNDAYVHDSDAYRKATTKLDALSRGLVIDEDGKPVCLYAKLMSAKEKLSQANSLISQTNFKIRTCMERADSLQITAADHAEYVEQRARIEQLQDEIVHLERGNSAGHLEQLNARIEQLQEQIRTLEGQLAGSNEASYNLAYSDPKFHGMAAKLFSLRSMEAAAALMLAGGDNLRHFVTDDPRSCINIFKLGRRVTCIPMSGMNVDYMLEQRIIEQAQLKYGKEQVFSPLQLIKYEPRFEQLLRFVFGKTLICSDLTVLERIANDPEIMCRSVSLDGFYVCEPNEQPASATSSDNLFEDLEYIEQLKTQLAAKKLELEQLEQSKIEYERHIETLELRQFELSVWQPILANTSYVLKAAELKDIRKQRKVASKRNAKARRCVQKTLSPAVEQIEAKLAYYNENRQRLIESAQLEAQLTRQSAEMSSRNFMPLKQQFQILQLTIRQTKQSLRRSKTKVEQDRQNYEQQVQDLQQASLRAADEVAALEHALKVCQKEVRLQQQQQTALLNEKQTLLEQNMEIELQLKSKQLAKKQSSAAVEKARVFEKLDKFRLQAWRKVNKHFEAIINSLLPGAMLSLTAVRTDGFLSGLQFGGAEPPLCNGHKPLVAFAFVLAVLKCTPAPLYILDQLDAALDICETQNIANTFKKHFGGSQFLVRSNHREDLFANAKKP